MERALILNLLLLAATSAALADEPAQSRSATTSPPAAGAPLATPSVKVAKSGTKKQGTNTRPADNKAEAPAPAGRPAQPADDVKMSGMSILGNEDAPKSLVLVPWKSSRLADMPTVSRLLDSAMQPVDKDVFMRELAYYEFKSSSK